jgi:hypothetical protein
MGTAATPRAPNGSLPAFRRASFALGLHWAGATGTRDAYLRSVPSEGIGCRGRRHSPMLQTGCEICATRSFFASPHARCRSNNLAAPSATLTGSLGLSGGTRPCNRATGGTFTTLMGSLGLSVAQVSNLCFQLATTGPSAQVENLCHGRRGYTIAQA